MNMHIGSTRNSKARRSVLDPRTSNICIAQPITLRLCINMLVGTNVPKTTQESYRAVLRPCVSAILVLGLLVGCGAPDVQVGHTYTVVSDSLSTHGEPCFVHAVDFLEYDTLLGVNLAKSKKFAFAYATWLHPGDRVTVMEYLGNIDRDRNSGNNPSELGARYHLRLANGATCYAINDANGSALFDADVTHQ